jgi:hypothetical protein
LEFCQNLLNLVLQFGLFEKKPDLLGKLPISKIEMIVLNSFIQRIEGILFLSIEHLEKKKAILNFMKSIEMVTWVIGLPSCQSKKIMLIASCRVTIEKI